jgi:hypothetical protein
MRVVPIKKKVVVPYQFFTYFSLNENNRESFKNNTPLQSAMVIEKIYTKRNIELLCFMSTCQSYGHTRYYCSQQPRFVQCGAG